MDCYFKKKERTKINKLETSSRDTAVDRLQYHEFHTLEQFHDCRHGTSWFCLLDGIAQISTSMVLV